jgi:hypothetical protein
MKTKHIFLLFMTLFFLTACAPQRIAAEAESYKTHQETDQKVLDTIQAREQKTAMDAIALREAERKQAVKDAALANVKSLANMFVRVTGIAGMVVVVWVMVSVGRGAGVALEGLGQAAARKAMVNANLIYIDPKTGQYPQLLEYLGGGRYSLTDLNDHSTLMLDTRNKPDLLAVQGAMAIRHALVMSNAASRSKDPTGVAMVQPLIIDAQMEVGNELS